MPQPTLLVLMLFTIQVCFSQQPFDDKVIKIMFYNVENLFDTIDNQLTNDDEFTPGGDKNWHNFRYWNKINKIFQVIAAVGRESPPEIIGLCEVENLLPLIHLTNNTPLLKYPYQIVHYNSPDKRGIDVALLVRKDKIKVLYSRPVPVIIDGSDTFTTRDILYAKLLLQNDTLHTFVNHWPSRRGGQSQSEYKRLLAAKTLINLTDSLLQKNVHGKIVVMGDFNDGPANRSLHLLEKGSLFNLSKDLQGKCRCGTYKYRNHWNMLDQFLVSASLLKNVKEGKIWSVTVFNNDFLLIDDPTYGGLKPFRTFTGPKYQGGFSDHLPILMELPVNYP